MPLRQIENCPSIHSERINNSLRVIFVGKFRKKTRNGKIHKYEEKDQRKRQEGKSYKGKLFIKKRQKDNPTNRHIFQQSFRDIDRETNRHTES